MNIKDSCLGFGLGSFGLLCADSLISCFSFVLKQTTPQGALYRAASGFAVTPARLFEAEAESGRRWSLPPVHISPILQKSRDRCRREGGFSPVPVPPLERFHLDEEPRGRMFPSPRHYSPQHPRLLGLDDVQEHEQGVEQVVSALKPQREKKTLKSSPRGEIPAGFSGGGSGR